MEICFSCWRLFFMTLIMMCVVLLRKALRYIFLCTYIVRYVGFYVVWSIKIVFKTLLMVWAYLLASLVVFWYCFTEKILFFPNFLLLNTCFDISNDKFGGIFVAFRSCLVTTICFLIKRILKA